MTAFLPDRLMARLHAQALIENEERDWLQQQETLDGVLDVEAGLKEILSPDRD